MTLPTHNGHDFRGHIEGMKLLAATCDPELSFPALCEHLAAIRRAAFDAMVLLRQADIESRPPSPPRLPSHRPLTAQDL